MRAQTTRFIVGALGLILIGLLAWVASLPPLVRPKVSITLVRYTNNVTGDRLATFAVTNLSASTIMVYHPVVEIPDPTGPAGLAIDQTHRPISWVSMIGRGASSSFTVPLPTNQTPWRIMLDADPDVGFARALQRYVTMRARRMPYNIECDWHEGTP